MAKQYKSATLAAAHETALGLAEAGVLPKQTMKAFDEMCLTSVEEMTAEKTREIRIRENTSQAVFARHLTFLGGTSVSITIRPWCLLVV